MRKKLFDTKNKLILFLSVSILLALTLSGCNWFGEGILNVFDPKAQIRVDHSEIKLAEGEGTIDLKIYSINQVEFIGQGFKYRYYNKGVLIPELSKDVGISFYVHPSDIPGKPGEITEIKKLPLYFKQAADYIVKNPLITEITCAISMFGTDGAGHNIVKSITVDLPALQPGIDIESPKATFEVLPGTTGTAPFNVVFDAAKSTDNRGIKDFHWDFGDGKTGVGIVVNHRYNLSGEYVVVLTVTDFWGNQGFATKSITVNEDCDDGDG